MWDLKTITGLIPGASGGGVSRHTRLAIVLAAAFWATPAHAVILDQEHTAVNSFLIFARNLGVFGQVAQTFTAGITGELTAISLPLGVRSPGGDGTVTIDIRNTQTSVASIGVGTVTTQIPGTPEIPSGGQILATIKLDISELPVIEPTTGGQAPFTPLIYFPTPVDVVAGQRYSILLRFEASDTSVELVWHRSSTDVYPDGSGFYRIGDGLLWTMPSWDLGFQTYVVPEPAAVFLAALAIPAIRRRRRV